MLARCEQCLGQREGDLLGLAVQFPNRFRTKCLQPSDNSADQKSAMLRELRGIGEVGAVTLTVRAVTFEQLLLDLGVARGR